MYYTQEQIDCANQADLVSFLQGQGEQLTRAGQEYRWKRHDSLTIRGNKWYRHLSLIHICSRSRESRKQLPAADSRLYWIYLHWKIQHWIIQRWKNLRRDVYKRQDLSR